MYDLISSGTSALSPAMTAASTVLRWLLAAFFLFLSYKAIGGDPRTAADFARWGYSPAFRQLTGVLQAIGALALLFPQTSFLAALLLAGVLLGATATHLLHDPWTSTVSPLAFLVLLALAAVPHLPPLVR